MQVKSQLIEELLRVEALLQQRNDPELVVKRNELARQLDEMNRMLNDPKKVLRG